MRHAAVGVLLLASISLGPASCQSSDEPEMAAEVATPTPSTHNATIGAKSMAIADGEVYLGGQPTQADLIAAVHYPGVRSVLDLRRESENRGFNEVGALGELEVAYECVPFGGPDELTDEVLDQSLAVIRTAPRPLVVHCASGNRVGAVWMAYRMLDDGYSHEQALAEARQAGLRNEEFIPVVVDYVARRRPARAPGK